MVRLRVATIISLFLSNCGRQLTCKISLLSCLGYICITVLCYTISRLSTFQMVSDAYRIICTSIIRPPAQMQLLFEDVALLELTVWNILLWLANFKSTYVVTTIAFISYPIYLAVKRTFPLLNSNSETCRKETPTSSSPDESSKLVFSSKVRDCSAAAAATGSPIWESRPWGIRVCSYQSCSSPTGPPCWSSSSCPSLAEWGAPPPTPTSSWEPS